MVRALAMFFACTTAILAAIVAWLVAPQFQRASQEERYGEEIIFPIKTFVGRTAYVAARGTLSADWIAHKNNTYSFYCDPEECIVASTEQVGAKMIQSIDILTYPVKRWTQDDAVIAEADDNPCSHTTITLDRKTERVLWVATPINETTLGCKDAYDTVRKATLEPSLYWQDFSKRHDRPQ
jgi:hypothetical protein